MSGRVVVGVSGAGSNLRALHAAVSRDEIPARIVLVFADRACPALDWAAEAGLETALLPALGAADPSLRAEADRTLAATLRAVEADVAVLAGYMRVVGPATLAAFPNRIINTHPALLPSFPGAHAVRDALSAGVAVTGATVHLVNEIVDGGPIVLQEPVDVLPDDDEAMLHERIKAVQHRLLPRAVALALAGALTVEPGQRRARIDSARVDAAVPPPRRVLLSVSDKTDLVPFAAALVRNGYELVSTGGTARALRDAGLPVTDVASVTGTREMLDGRVKTLHPRVHAGILADRRRADHREALIAAGIAPFDLVVVNLYPFAAAAARPGVALDDLVEEIDVGGPTLVRAAAKNHASVAILTSPDRYPAVIAAIEGEGSVPAGLRAALAAEAFRHTAAYDARIASELPGRMLDAGLALPPEPGLPGSADPYPPVLPLVLEKVQSLRYGENPHQPAARYRRVDRQPGLVDGLFAADGAPLQGKDLSYNNVLDASAASAIARVLRPPACVIVKHTNPCGAAERASLLDAWRAALAGDPESAFGGVVGVAGTIDGELARAMTELFLEVVVAGGFDDEARAAFAAKPNLRLIVDEVLSASRVPAPVRSDPLGAIRTAGGAVLVSTPDVIPDDPAAWRLTTRRAPTDRERADLDLAWRLVRGVTSNAIVLVRDGRLIGLGSGQTSRVDAARQAVAKARTFQPDALAGAVCASDAFFPVPDSIEVCLDAGVTAFVQPGGSVRDGQAIECADAADAAMLFTGIRHFRH